MSDVPEGYKMSEVGVIPEEWEVKSLENIGLFRKGKNIPKKDLTSEGVPCVLYGEIYTKYNFTSKKLNSFIPHAIAQQSTAINKGDILFAGSGETAEEIGKCFTYLGDEKACAGGDINILSPFNDDSTFLGYLLNSPQVNKQKSNLGQGSSVVHIYSSSLKTILIPSPPLPEQQAIASALSDVDALIAALEQLITKKRNIKQGAMQQLLTGKKRLPGFGGAWEVKNFPDVCWFQEGPGLRNWQFTNEGMKVINVTNLENGYLNLDMTDRHISIDEFNKMYQHFEIDDKDIVVASSGNSYAKTAVVRKRDLPLMMNTSVIRFKPLKTLEYNFLLSFLKSDLFKDQIDLLITGGAQPNFGPAHLKEIKITIPEYSEQQAIAKILSDMDTEIEALEQKRDKYKAIKQGMMQELLTGKRRLV